MFRTPLRSLVRWLMVLPLAAGATPAFAGAGVDVDEVLFIVTDARTSEGPDAITLEVRVKGTSVTSGTSHSITFPANSTVTPKTRPLQELGNDLVFGLEIGSELELAAAVPAGNYVLQIANDTVQVTVGYDARPAVPSPDISQPSPNQVLLPGPVEVLFTDCGAACSLGLDSVEAVLEDRADPPNELASETLTEDDDSWIPPDGMGGDFELPELSEFIVRITHSAVRQEVAPVTGGAEAIAAVTQSFIRSDEIGFETGFVPPTGDFCVVVNDLTPPVGCSPVNDPALSLLDTSGAFSTTINGGTLDVDFTFTVGPKGDLTGTATADLDDNGSNETGPAAIKGKLKGKAGELKQKLSFPLENEALAAKLKLSISDVLSIPFNSIERVQKTSGNLGATKVKEETPTNGALPFAPLGWRIDFSVDGSGEVQNGVLTLDNARTFPLLGTDKFNVAKNESSLKLETADKGIKIQLKKVLLDDETVPTAVRGGDLSYKILGQSGKAALPTPP